MIGPYRTPAEATTVVRSIRVGAALNEQFGALLRRRIYNDPERLTSLLGEARQLYPEIWSNLDDARKALVERGVPTDRYDALRASSAARNGGVLDVQVTEQTLTQAALRTGYEKTANLNAEGHAAATEACNVLRAALPHVDWEALDRAEAEELAAFGSLGPSRARKLVFYTLAGIAAAMALVLLVVWVVHNKCR
jgi:hypothetical protein